MTDCYGVWTECLFLGATKHLFNWLCPSVGQLVSWSVGWSVDRSVAEAFVWRYTRRIYWPTWPCSLNASLFSSFTLCVWKCDTGTSSYFVSNWEKKADMCTWLIKNVWMNVFDEWTFLMIAWKWMRVNEGEWRWMKVNESGKVTRRKIDARIGSFSRFWHLRNRLTDQTTNWGTGMTSYTLKDNVKFSLV